MKSGKELKDAARRKSSAQKSEYHDTNVVTPGEGPAAQVGSGVGNEAAGLAPQVTALVPPSPIDRRAALGAILTGGAAALIAPIIPGGNSNLGLPGSPTDGVFRKMMILSAPSGFPDDGSYTGLGWYGDGWSGINLGSWKTGVLQVGWDGTTGALTAGAGAVTLDQNGISILSGSIRSSSIAWLPATTPYIASSIYNFVTGNSPNRSAKTIINSFAESGGSNYAEVDITAWDSTGGASGAVSLNLQTGNGALLLLRNGNLLNINKATGASAANGGTLGLYAGTDDNLYRVTEGGQSGIWHHGDYAGYAVWTNDNGVKTIYSRTIKGGSLGTKGFFIVDLTNKIATTASNDVKSTMTITLGSTTLFSWTSVNTGAAANRHAIEKIILIVTNAGSASAQNAILWITQRGSITGLGTGFIAGNASVAQQPNVATENSANDLTLTVTQALNTSTTSKFEFLGGVMLGPYYGA